MRPIFEENEKPSERIFHYADKRKYIPMNLPIKQQEGRKTSGKKNVHKSSISARWRTKNEQHTQTGQNISKI